MNGFVEIKTNTKENKENNYYTSKAENEKENQIQIENNNLQIDDNNVINPLDIVGDSGGYGDESSFMTIEPSELNVNDFLGSSETSYTEDDFEKKDYETIKIDNNNKNENTNSLKEIELSQKDLFNSAYSNSGEYNFGMNSGCPIQWNTTFQKILEMKQDTEEEKMKKYQQLTSLSYNFIHTAKSVGKIIIEERSFKDEYKTIRPRNDIKGVAGGVKYIYHGILFKFAVKGKIYDNDEKARV